MRFKLDGFHPLFDSPLFFCQWTQRFFFILFLNDSFLNFHGDKLNPIVHPPPTIAATNSTYFRWLGSALLPALVIPLLIRLGSLPHPAAALPSSPNKRRCSFSRAPAASATETKANQSSLPPHAPSCGGLVVISSLACLAASGALGASDLSLRAHAFALSLWACHLNLIATSHHNNAISSPSSQRTTERKDENEEVRKESEETEGKEEVFLFPFPWPPPLHGVLTIGMALTGAGIVTMWRMW